MGGSQPTETHVRARRCEANDRVRVYPHHRNGFARRKRVLRGAHPALFTWRDDGVEGEPRGMAGATTERVP